MDLHIDVDAVPISWDRDDESGEVTAYNDDQRVMAIADTPEEAARRFRETLGAMVLRELTAGRPLPEVLRRHVRLLTPA